MFGNGLNITEDHDLSGEEKRYWTVAALLLQSSMFKAVLNNKRVLTLSLLLTMQEALVDSVDQDQTAQNAQSDL